MTANQNPSCFKDLEHLKRQTTKTAAQIDRKKSSIYSLVIVIVNFIGIILGVNRSLVFGLSQFSFNDSRHSRGIHIPMS